MTKYKYLFVALLLITLTSCGFKHPDMVSKELDSQAKQFEASSSKAKLYIIRPSKFGGVGLELFPTINQYASGTLASGSYMMLELDPGDYFVSAAGNLQDPESVRINARAGQLYFIQMYPKVKIGLVVALSPGLHIEVLDPAEARNFIMDLYRFNAVTYGSYLNEPTGSETGTLYFFRPKTFYGAASNNKISPLVDSRVVGSVEMGRCIKVPVRPGAQTISAIGKFEGNYSLDLMVEKENDYFIMMTPQMGMAYPKLKIEVVDHEKARSLVLDCMENNTSPQ